MSSKRGGRRPGAGRPPLISAEERVARRDAAAAKWAAAGLVRPATLSRGGRRPGAGRPRSADVCTDTRRT